jgi:hypothetical protein
MPPGEIAATQRLLNLITAFGNAMSEELFDVILSIGSIAIMLIVPKILL